MKSLLHPLFHAIFWAWNVVFLVVVPLGLLPLLALDLLRATLRGTVPIDFALSLAGLIIVPLLATLLGLWRWRRDPVQLFRLFYGVEAPLVLLCLLRLFGLRELTPASAQMLISFGICILAFAVDLGAGFLAHRPVWARFQLVSHSLLLLVGLYTGAILLIYALPIATWLAQQFFSLDWLEPLQNWVAPTYLRTNFWWMAVLLLLLLILVSFTVIAPSVMAALYVHAGQRTIRAYQRQYGQRQALSGAIAGVMASLIVFAGLAQQPQVATFARLDRPALTDGDRRERWTDAAMIRSGLLNAYLSPYRYLGSTQETTQVQTLYRDRFRLPVWFAQGLQQIHNRLLAPFLYQGSQQDVAKAERLYEQFFDTPLRTAERAIVTRALQATPNREAAQTSIRNFNQETVWLSAQQITVQEQGDWAEVELHEVYENQSTQPHEVSYSFSLPETAVVTGLWLGDSDDRSQRYPFTVVPRDQPVYPSQPTLDRLQEVGPPAWVEQVGTRHYRLRTYPVPPLHQAGPGIFGSRSAADRPVRLHLWLSYRVMQQPQGWALPQLGEARHIFWTSGTDRSRNGKPSPPQSQWLEPFLAAAKPYRPTVHQLALIKGYFLSAKPLTATESVLPTHQRIAVVLDTSRSMAAQKPAIGETLQWLKTHGFANNKFADNDADLYLTAADGAPPKRLDDISQFQLADLLFYGHVPFSTLLQQFQQQRQQTAYDAILLLTDATTYTEKFSGPIAVAPPSRLEPSPVPIWLVHLSALPPAYDDAIAQAIVASGGGVSTTVPDVLRRMTTQAALGPPVIGVEDGYIWQMQKVPVNPGVPPIGAIKDGFAAIAARQLVRGLSQRTDLTQLTQLATVQTIAQTFRIVTPYSTLLVLTDDLQRESFSQSASQPERSDRWEAVPAQPPNSGNRLTRWVAELATAFVLGILAIGGFGLIRGCSVRKLPSEERRQSGSR